MGWGRKSGDTTQGVDADAIGEGVKGAAAAGAAGAVAAGLISGGVAAAVPLAITGIMAMTPGAREQRKFERETREAAVKAWNKGKAKGFGPSVSQRNRMVRRQMRDQDQAFKSTDDVLSRQEAAMGIGRSGHMASMRQDLARQRANKASEIRAGVEDRARQIGEQRRREARQNLDQAMGLLSQRNAEKKQFAMEVGTGAVTVGMQAAKDHKDREERERNSERNANMMEAILGIKASGAE